MSNLINEAAVKQLQADSIALANQYTDERVTAAEAVATKEAAEVLATLLPRIKALEAKLDGVVTVPDPDPEPFISYLPVNPKANEDITITVANANSVWVQLRPGGTAKPATNEETGGTVYTKTVRMPEAGVIRVEANPDGQGGNDASLMIEVGPADGVDPVDPVPGDREVQIVKPGGIGYSLTNIPNPPADVVIRDKAFIGEGPPESNFGIRIVSRVKTVTIDNVEIGNMGAGIVVQAPNKADGEAERHVIESLVIRNSYIHDIYKSRPGTARGTRTQGVYTERVRKIRFEDCFFDQVGYLLPERRNGFSHIPYISTDDGIEVEVEFVNCVFNNASSHAINVDVGGTTTLRNVICANSAVHFGVKKHKGTPTGCYSVNVFKGKIENDQGWVNVGWDWYQSNPLGKWVTVIDHDPIDWARLRKTWGDWYDVALADLKASVK